jgi:hypothetical protein
MKKTGRGGSRAATCQGRSGRRWRLDPSRACSRGRRPRTARRRGVEDVEAWKETSRGEQSSPSSGGRGAVVSGSLPL